MGLKDLKSRLDLLGGFQVEGEPLGGMENFQPEAFQRPLNVADQAHKDSLNEVPGGTQNSPFQDLNIDVNTQTPSAFQFPTDIADQVHQSSLSLVPGGSQNSPFQDLDGEQGPQFQKPLNEADQFHQDSLSDTQSYNYSHGGTLGQAGPVPGGTQNSPYQDLNGVDNGNGPFHGIANPQLGQGLQLNGVDLHEALLNNAYTYQHGGSTANILNGSPVGGTQDLNGTFPAGGQYINNLPD